MTRLAKKMFWIRVGALYAVWVLVSWRFTSSYLALGFLLSLGVAWLNAGQLGIATRAFPLVRFLVYVPWLFSRMVRSSLHLTYLILHPRMPLNPMLLPYRSQLRDKTAITILGNSITLTPGTITAEVSQQGLLVHALDQDSMSDLVSGRLERRIARVFRRIETG